MRPNNLSRVSVERVRGSSRCWCAQQRETRHRRRLRRLHQREPAFRNRSVIVTAFGDQAGCARLLRTAEGAALPVHLLKYDRGKGRHEQMVLALENQFLRLLPPEQLVLKVGS